MPQFCSLLLRDHLNLQSLSILFRVFPSFRQEVIRACDKHTKFTFISNLNSFMSHKQSYDVNMLLKLKINHFIMCTLIGTLKALSFLIYCFTWCWMHGFLQSIDMYTEMTINVWSMCIEYHWFKGFFFTKKLICHRRCLDRKWTSTN